MLKKSVLYFSVLTLIFMQSSFAKESAQLHFSTIGGPSMVGQMSSDMLDANLINDASVKYSGNDENNAKTAGKRYYNYYNNNANANESDNEYNASYNFKKGSLNTKQERGIYVEEGYSGVNSSKTMYTDELGRLHFFGKGNLIRE